MRPLKQVIGLLSDDLVKMTGCAVSPECTQLKTLNAFLYSTGEFMVNAMLAYTTEHFLSESSHFRLVVSYLVGDQSDWYHCEWQFTQEWFKEEWSKMCAIMECLRDGIVDRRPVYTRPITVPGTDGKTVNLLLAIATPQIAVVSYLANAMQDIMMVEQFDPKSIGSCYATSLLVDQVYVQPPFQTPTYEADDPLRKFLDPLMVLAHEAEKGFKERVRNMLTELIDEVMIFDVPIAKQVFFGGTLAGIVCMRMGETI